MIFKSIDLMYFSPTGTTRNILTHIAKGFDAPSVTDVDLTLPRPAAVSLKGDMTLIGAPVYGGRIPPLAVKRLTQSVSKGKPAVIVVLYGNREYEDALLELADLAESSGFAVVAAGAFIGEHSFATTAKPIAMGRPNPTDLATAMAFGRRIAAKMAAIDCLPIDEKVTIPGNFPYKESHKSNRPAPETNTERCTLCGTCATVCPTEAITVDDQVTTRQEDCIACCACIKACPAEARVYTAEPINKIRNFLFENCSEPKKPVVFL